MPAVSVIIPAYNGAATIGEALKSVFAQSFTDHEVIVVNDGSPDTAALEMVLQPFRDRLVYLRAVHGGPSAARNAGIRAARAPLVALLDADDAWETDYLATQVDAFRRDPAVAVVYPNGIIVGDGRDAGRLFMDLCPSEGEVTLERLVLLQCTVGGGAMARRDAIIRAGLFDESLLTSEDFDLWLRIVKQGGRIVYHRRVLYRYHKHRGSLSSEPVRICHSAMRVLDKLERTMALTPSEADAVRRARVGFGAHLRFIEGSRALLAGDAQLAREALADANRVFRRPKIGFALFLLRVAPRALVQVCRLREQRAMRTAGGA